jgi:tyrosinase
VYGFGGNGADIPHYAGQFGNLSTLASAGWVAPGAGGGCVTDGPFAAYNLSVGPGTNTTDHCLQRAFNDNIRGFLSSEKIAEVTRQTTYEAFRTELEGAPVTATMRLHDGGHNAVGGEMADRYSSPGGKWNLRWMVETKMIYADLFYSGCRPDILSPPCVSG